MGVQGFRGLGLQGFRGLGSSLGYTTWLPVGFSGVGFTGSQGFSVSLGFEAFRVVYRAVGLVEFHARLRFYRFRFLQGCEKGPPVRLSVLKGASRY